MNIVIILVAICYAVVAIWRPRWALLCFVFLTPLMPRYFAIALGDGGAALTLSRVLSYLTFFALVALLFKYQNRFVSLFRELWNESIVRWVLLLYACKLFATLLNSPSGMVYLLDDMVTTLMFMLAVLLILSNERYRYQLLLVIVASLGVSELLAVIEYTREMPLLQGVINVEIAADRDYLSGLSRDDNYRVIVGYANPLLFSQFVCLSWPLALFLFLTSKTLLNRVLLLFILIMSLPSILMTDARSGVLVYFIAWTLTIGLVYWKKSGSTIRRILEVLTFLVMILIASHSMKIIQDPSTLFSPDEKGFGSVEARLNQYVAVSTVLTQKPLLGAGKMQNYAKGLEDINNLDNYWLRIALESGFLGVICFLMTGVLLVWKQLFNYINEVNKHEAIMWLCFLASTISLYLHMLFVSMPTNSVYLYILIALVVASQRMTRKKYKQLMEVVE